MIYISLLFFLVWYEVFILGVFIIDLEVLLHTVHLLIVREG